MRAQHRWLLVGVLLVLCMVPPRILAQDGADSPVIIDSGAEVVYPAALHFYADLDVSPEALNGVQLSLEQDAQTLFDGVVVPDIVENEDGTIRVRFDWPFTREEAPAFFEGIDYEWQVRLEGNLPVVEQGRIEFQPGAGEWRLGGESPLMFAVADSNLNLSATYQAVVPAYTLMTQQTGLELEFVWVVVPRDFSFCLENSDEESGPESVVVAQSDPAVMYPCDESEALALLDDQGFVLLKRGRPGLLPFQDDVVKVVFDEFYAAYWRGRQVPAWFEAGLRRYYLVNPDPLLLRQVQEAARTGLLYDASQLDRGPVDSDVYDLWTAQTASMVLYLADQYGADAPFDLAAAVADSGFQPAFDALTGRTWDVFLLEWERWLFTPEAARGAAWTVYLPETATPTSVSTVTLVPTETGVLTATAEAGTATPNAEALPGLVTALSTTPTETGSPLAATNTPRPPGSLGLQSGASEASSSPQSGGLCGAALPALLFPLAAVVSVENRRKRA